VARRSERQPVLIDTAGCDPFDPGQAAALLALARASGADIVAVLPAGLDAQESADLARAFAVLGARHLLPTRLDAARRLGGILAAAAAGLALTEAGTGPGVADGLTPLSPEWLARRLEQGWSAPQEVSP
jgi:flagellar biosynthesis protein FlhF